MDDITPDAGAAPLPPSGDAGAPARATCERCGGAHTRRQRCPLVPDPEPERDARGPSGVAQPRAPGQVLRGAVFSSGDGPFVAVLRCLGAIFGTIVLTTCVTIALVIATAILPGVDVNVAGALVGIIISAAVGLVFGAGIMWFSARVYAKVVFCLLALVLITAGFFMMVFAPVLRQMNTPGLAEYRAFNSLLLFGAISLLLGLALAAQCLRWALRPHARRSLARWSRLLASAYGVMIGISGLFGFISLFVLINAHESTGSTSVVEQAIRLATVAVWSFVPGLILTYQGISASMGEGSSEFRPPVAAGGVALFAGVLLLGHLNMRAEDPIAAPMPVLHVAAAALPGLTFMALAARGSLLRGAPTRWLTWRQFTLAMAISMSLATLIASYVESIGSVGAVVLMLVHNGVFANAVNSDDVTDIIQNSRYILTRNEQFVAGLITAAVLAPLSEEFSKSLSVRFMMRRATTRAQAFLLGAAAGAAFGFLEAMLYGLHGISSDLGHWWQIMLLRGGSTSLHVLCTGLTGLAWWYWTIARRDRLALGLFGLAVAFHATWNGVFTMIDSRIFGLDTLSDHTLEVIAYTIVAIVSGAFIAAIPVVARLVRDITPPVAGTPLAAMSPWLG